MKHTIHCQSKRIIRAAIICVVLLLGSAASIKAQWQVVASAIFPPTSAYGYGAMAYKDGNLCVGYSNIIFRSTDLGGTWTQATTPFGGRTTEMVFYDKNVGLCATNSATYLTQDGGLNWSFVPAPGPGAYGIAFLGSAQEFAIAGVDLVLHVTTDQGSAWMDSPLPESNNFGLISKGNKLYCESSPSSGPYSSIYVTSDRGVTWLQETGSIDYDSFSFSIDSCDENTIYIPNEGIATSLTGLSQIWVSSDRGATFVSKETGAIPNFSGSIAVAPHAVYCPRINGGIMRSTDHGSTWKSIGGPSEPGDTRLICAASDNILFAMDVSGSILRTMNSGGDSVVGPIGASTLSTQNISNDTIGATIYVPILGHGTRPIGAVDLSVGYDTAMLVYQGAFLRGGTNDRTTSRGKNYAHVHFDATASTDSVVGYATFRIFPRTSTCSDVTFDSIEIPLNQIACSAVAPSFKSTVCSKLGCGTPTISDFLRYGKTPQLTITPNPAANTVSLHTDVDVGEASIELYDVAGVLRTSLHMQLTASAATQLDLSTLPSGMYTVRVRSAAIDRSISMMHLK